MGVMIPSLRGASSRLSAGRARPMLTPVAGRSVGRRHPADLLRLVGGLVVVGLAGLLATRPRVVAVEEHLFRLVNDLPGGLVDVMRPVMWFATWPALPVLAGVALVVWRRPRPALDLVVAWTGTSLAGDLVRHLVERSRPATLLTGAQVRTGVTTVLAYPSGHTAAAAALATAAAPFLPRRARRALWVVVGVVAVGRVYLGAHLPLDVLGGAALGWAVGSTIHLVLGAPGHRTQPAAVARWLDRHGFGPSQVRAIVSDARSSFPFLATSPSTDLFVKAVGREQRDADLLWKGWRRLLYQQVEDEMLFTASKQQVEHEATVALLAGAAHVRTPQVLAVGMLDGGDAVLVQEAVPDARSLDQIEPERRHGPLLRALWREVDRLHDAGIAHRDLKAANIMVDGRGDPWLVDLGFGELDASELAQARDVAELLATTTLLAGPDEAVAAAASVLAGERLAAAVPYLYPGALTAPTRKALRHRRGLLRQLRAATSEAAAVQQPHPARVLRFGWRSLLVLAVGAFAVHVLLPQVAELGTLRTAVTNARWPLLAVAAVIAACRYPLAALQQRGALTTSPPFATSVAVQVAAAYANRAAPGGLGGAGVRERYLERCGFDRAVAVASVGLTQVSGALVHGVALLVVAAAVGQLGVARLRMPPRWEVAVAVGTLVVGLGVLATPYRRRVLVPIRRAVASLREVLTDPGRAGELLGGGVGVLVASTAVLVVCLHAFGADLPVANIALIFLGGSALASLSPTPGGLGALEIALVAGLTGAGATSAVALSGVLTYRLLTFWLPLGTGAVAFRALRRRGSL